MKAMESARGQGANRSNTRRYCEEVLDAPAPPRRQAEVRRFADPTLPLDDGARAPSPSWARRTTRSPASPPATRCFHETALGPAQRAGHLDAAHRFLAAREDHWPAWCLSGWRRNGGLGKYQLVVVEVERTRREGRAVVIDGENQPVPTRKRRCPNAVGTCVVAL
jgi:hypothetical protein